MYVYICYWCAGCHKSLSLPAGHLLLLIIVVLAKACENCSQCCLATTVFPAGRSKFFHLLTHSYTHTYIYVMLRRLVLCYCLSLCLQVAYFRFYHMSPHTYIHIYACIYTYMCVCVAIHMYASPTTAYYLISIKTHFPVRSFNIVPIYKLNQFTEFVWILCEF